MPVLTGIPIPGKTFLYIEMGPGDEFKNIFWVKT